jgi:hypothetical protein
MAGKPRKKKQATTPKKLIELRVEARDGRYVYLDVPDEFIQLEKKMPMNYGSGPRVVGDKQIWNKWSDYARRHPDEFPETYALTNQGTDWTIGRLNRGATKFILNHSMTVTTDYTPPPPLPGRFDDVPENLALDRKEVTALRKALAATKGMTKTEFLNAVSPLKADTQVISVTIPITHSLEEATAKVVREAETLLAPSAKLMEAFKGVDIETRTRTLRHLAHLYNIEKGATWLR